MPLTSRPRRSFGVSVAPTLKLSDTVVGLLPKNSLNEAVPAASLIEPSAPPRPKPMYQLSRWNAGRYESGCCGGGCRGVYCGGGAYCGGYCGAGCAVGAACAWAGGGADCGAAVCGWGCWAASWAAASS